MRPWRAKRRDRKSPAAVRAPRGRRAPTSPRVRAEETAQTCKSGRVDGGASSTLRPSARQTRVRRREEKKSGRCPLSSAVRDATSRPPPREQETPTRAPSRPPFREETSRALASCLFRPETSDHALGQSS